MGASDFWNEGEGKTAREVFAKVRAQVEAEEGRRPYSGNITEKSDFTMVTDSNASVLGKARKYVEERKAEGLDEWGQREVERLEKDIAAFEKEPTPSKLAGLLIDIQDERYEQKHGPALCVVLGEGKAPGTKRFAFFGIASS